MRGYESKTIESIAEDFLVTHPHEGLWERFFKTAYCSADSYASPWGVMRGYFTNLGIFKSPLRIPMRGYEKKGKQAIK